MILLDVKTSLYLSFVSVISLKNVSIFDTWSSVEKELTLRWELLVNKLAHNTKAISSNKLLIWMQARINPLSANLTKWSNTLKQFVGILPTNCLSVFDHFVGLTLEGLKLHKVYKSYKAQT